MPDVVEGEARAPGPVRTAREPEAEFPARLAIRGLTKIFTRDPRPALAMLAAGAGKDEVHRKLGVVVGVDDANFSIRDGEIFVIMGLSGSGKSTIVRMLNRLVEPSAGEVLLDGRDLARLSNRDLIAVRRREMSMVFQSFGLMPHLTVLDNAAFGLEMAGVPKAQRRETAMHALEQVGLGEYYAPCFPHELSGGMQQRVGLARALANDPEIMLMDEAFSALDPLIRSEMQDELLRLQRERRRTVVFISHDPDEAMRIADRIAVMRQGRIVQIGRPSEILRSPVDDYVRAFFRNVNIARALKAGDLARIDADCTVLPASEDLRPALGRLVQANRTCGYVCDTAGQFQGIISRGSLEQALASRESRLDRAYLPGIAPVAADEPVQMVLRRVASAEHPVPVIDESGLFLGTLRSSDLLETLGREN